MNTVWITAIICITLILLVIGPLGMAWSSDRSIKEMIVGKHAKMDEKTEV